MSLKYNDFAVVRSSGLIEFRRRKKPSIETLILPR